MSREVRPTPSAILFDVMDTLVHDPFRGIVPDVLGMDLATYFERTDRSVYEAFEQGRIDLATWQRSLFRDGMAVPDAFVDGLTQRYRWIQGVPALLEDLRAAGLPMHALSNYSELYQRIEARLGLARFVPWTFVSCRTGRRKPEVETYTAAAAHLEVPPSRLLFVDDREGNCDGARRAGMDAVRFEDVPSLRAALRERGLPV